MNYKSLSLIAIGIIAVSLSANALCGDCDRYSAAYHLDSLRAQEESERKQASVCPKISKKRLAIYPLNQFNPQTATLISTLFATAGNNRDKDNARATAKEISSVCSQAIEHIIANKSLIIVPKEVKELKPFFLRKKTISDPDWYLKIATKSE